MVDLRDRQPPQRVDGLPSSGSRHPRLQTGHDLAQQVVDLAVPQRVVVADLRGDHVRRLALGCEHQVEALLDAVPDLLQLGALLGCQPLGEPVPKDHVELVREPVEPLRVTDESQCAGKGSTLRRRLHHVLSALEVLTQHLACRPLVLPQGRHDVALHGLDRLGDPREVRREVARQVQHVLRLLEQLLVVRLLDHAGPLDLVDSPWSRLISTGRSRGRCRSVALARPRRNRPPELIDRLGDLGVCVGDRHRRPVRGEDDREHGDDERGISATQEVKGGDLKATRERR